MPLRRILIVLFIIAVRTDGMAAPTLLPQTEIGKEYHLVRRYLLRTGNVPVGQISPRRDLLCFGTEETCEMYPELYSCAADQNAPCRFEWKSEHGQRFYVTTTGEDPHNLSVDGFRLDHPYELKHELIK